MFKTLLENIVFISNNLVVLQTLRAGYKFELECDNTQQIKNFRGNALISYIQDILNDLEPFMVYLAKCEQDKNIPADQQKHLRDLIIDLTEFHDWAIAEIRLRNKRLALIKLEQEWNK